MAKLTDQQRKEIVTRRANGEKLQVIADAYGVTKACVSIICKKERALANSYLEMHVTPIQ